MLEEEASCSCLTFSLDWSDCFGISIWSLPGSSRPQKA